MQSRTWEEAKHHAGKNFITGATGGQWTHEGLHRARDGRFYIEAVDSVPRIRICGFTNEQAVSWLVMNGHELPSDLQSVAGHVSE